MFSKLLLTVVLILACTTVRAEDLELTPYAGVPGWAKTKRKRLEWFKDAKFGMFIHWGLYAPAGGYWPPDPETGKKYPQHYSEWIRNWANVSEPEYGDKTKPLFQPDQGCTDEWAELAKNAGMKYAVLTTKHHDGYTLFNAKAPYSVENSVTRSTNISPKDRDLVGEYASSMRKQGLKVGYYYSIIDWQHPDALPHARRWPLGQNPDHSRYIQYLHSHILQLFTDYGKSDLLWVDFSSAGFQGKTWKTHDLLTQLYNIQPDMLINNRFWNGLENEKGDFFTPEKYVPPTGYPDKCFEVCHTMNESFGFSHHDKKWKSAKEVVHLLVDIVSKGGNLLLNVGPDAKGHIPKESVDSLLGTGKWLDIYGGAVYSTSASPFVRLPFKGYCTQKPATDGNTTLYVHLTEWPESQRIQLPGLKNAVIDSKLFGQETSLTMTKDVNGVIIDLPASAPDAICSVIAVTIQGTPEVDKELYAIQTKDREITLPAYLATLTGPRIKMESFNNQLHIGWWLDKSATARIPLLINSPGRVQPGGIVSKEPGLYEVFVEYAADAAGGGTLKLGLANNAAELVAQIEPTGTWNSFVTRKIGEIKLSKAGKDMAKLEALKINKAGFMNFRKLILKPIEK